MNSSMEYMGLSLKNPVIAASGPWSRNAQGIQRAIDAGAAAVVTETISLESSRELSPRIYARDGDILNTTLYSPVSFDQWEEEMGKIQKKGSFVIANIRGSSSSEFAYIAAKMERWDADAVELTPFTPIGVQLDGLDTVPDQIAEIIKAVRDSVSIPVSVRIPFYLAERRDFVQAIEAAGASGIGTTESIKAIWGVDILKCRSLVPTFGGYTGTFLRPIMLASVASLSQISSISIAAIGGIRTMENALEAIMLGASAVQIGSGILMDGYEVLTDISNGIDQWLNEQGGPLKEIRGSALGSIRTFEDLRFLKRTAVVREGIAADSGLSSKLVKCCLPGAISYNDNAGLAVDASLCNGCGLCVSVAPDVMGLR